MSTIFSLHLEHRLPFLKGPRKVIFGFALAALLAVAGIGYYMLVYRAAHAVQASTLQTAAVLQGDIVLSASGTGTLTAPEEKLGFSAGGEMTVTGVYVKAGDLVPEGHLLAEVDSTQVQSDYEDARRAYLDLTSAPAIANAQQAMADAQSGLDSAMFQLEYLISPDVFYWETEVQKGRTALNKAQDRLDASPSDADAKKSAKAAEDYLGFAQDKLDEAWKLYYKEYVPETFPIAEDGDTDVYLVPTDVEIEQARAAIGDARTKLNESQELYDVLTGTETMPEDTSNPWLIAIETAKSALNEAQARLDGAKITAPFSGTIMQVNASGGNTAEANPAADSEAVDASTIMVIADTGHPYLEVFWDESDWGLLKVGDSVEITFDDLPDRVFSGKITEVDSSLYTSGNTTAVRGEVSLDTSFAELDLPIGAAASVEAVSQKAEDALYIPVEALHETSPGRYAVFVLVDGKPRVRTVEVGIQNGLYAQITSGLKSGDMVTTGVTRTQ